ncbi:hypothetical protein MIND_00406200 [Mycena indigotica]|uniref:Uncharacterized protein n=1 Tax=Mycena indigotica TaxID=2126181 RepID=A0A8H6WBJ7_9AGAR|nr:uncharacterized protein MIND_00406200 [Mycena indigotica]KAF7310321.1 hypothetical protein MIND_00406200 [Mycena indigotica]
MQLLAALYPENHPPFANDEDLYATIDSIPLGDIPWQSFSVKYTGELPDDPPTWMTDTYEVWFRSPLDIFEKQLGNPDFKDEMDWAPKRVYRDGKRQYTDVFSGNWVWRKADELAKDPENHGAMIVPVIIGSDKTCTSVGTGHTEFYPMYGGIANLYNAARRAHREGISLLGFLAIPKSELTQLLDQRFQNLLGTCSYPTICSKRSVSQVSASTLSCLDCAHPQRAEATHEETQSNAMCRSPLPGGQSTRLDPSFPTILSRHYIPVLYRVGVQCSCLVPTSHSMAQRFRCLSPPEDLDRHSAHRCKEHTQMLLDAGYTLKELWDEFGIVGDIVPFTDDFPRADIHELISVDLLHQLITGTFKDHLVDWVVEYIETVHDAQEAREILADIDRRYLAFS